MRSWCFTVLVGCGSAAAAAHPSEPARRADAAVPLASVSPSTSAPSSALDACAPHDLDTLLFEREHVGASTKPGSFVDARVKKAVIACYAEIPPERRSTDAVLAATIEWPNSGFQGEAGGGLGLRGRGAGGGGDYPPKVTDEAFTACVTRAIPRELVSSLDPDAPKIRSIKLTVLAYSRGAVDRYLTGGIGRGAGGGAGAGFGRGHRECRRPDRDESSE